MRHLGSIFLVFALALSSQSGFAEQTMDSEDALSMAEVTAVDRAQRGKFTEALASEQNALKLAENRYGPTHPSLVPILADLATLDRDLALYPQAESNLQWALAIRQRNFGIDDLRTAESLGQLASLYFYWGHWEDAEFFQRKAVVLYKQAPASAADPQRLAEAFGLWGQIELEFGKKDDALSLLKKCGEILEKIPEVPASQLIQSLNLLASTYHALGKYPEEGSCLEKALQTAQKGFKANAVELADAQQSLAGFYHSQGREKEAQPLYDSALKIYQGCVGSYFGYSSLPYVQKLAKARMAAKQWKEAEGLLQNILPSCREIYGTSHPQVAVFLLELAQAQEGLGQTGIARENLKTALQMARSFYRDDHPLVLQIQKELRR